MRIIKTLIGIFWVALVVVLVGLATGCQTPGDDLTKHIVNERERVEQDKDFEEHIAYFEYLVEEEVKRTIVSYDLPKGRDFNFTGVLGVCFPDINHVTINPELWPELEKYQRYALIAHELLHCAYGIPHRRDRVAIMNPAMLGEKALVDFWPLLIAEIQTYPRSNHQFMLDSMLPIPLIVALRKYLPIPTAAGIPLTMQASEVQGVLSFCRINNHGSPSGECTNKILACMQGDVGLRQCTEEYLLNNNYEMGVCPDPEIMKNLGKRSQG